jgi:hypothetical protein
VSVPLRVISLTSIQYPPWSIGRSISPFPSPFSLYEKHTGVSVSTLQEEKYAVSFLDSISYRLKERRARRKYPQHIRSSSAASSRLIVERVATRI